MKSRHSEPNPLFSHSDSWNFYSPDLSNIIKQKFWDMEVTSNYLGWSKIMTSVFVRDMQRKRSDQRSEFNGNRGGKDVQKGSMSQDMQNFQEEKNSKILILLWSVLDKHCPDKSLLLAVWAPELWE